MWKKDLKCQVAQKLWPLFGVTTDWGKLTTFDEKMFPTWQSYGLMELGRLLSIHTNMINNPPRQGIPRFVKFKVALCEVFGGRSVPRREHLFVNALAYFLSRQRFYAGDRLSGEVWALREFHKLVGFEDGVLEHLKQHWSMFKKDRNEMRARRAAIARWKNNPKNFLDQPSINSNGLNGFKHPRQLR